jgi:hypothetical protein
MYETLVRVNCEGSVVPGAAEKWMTEDSGLTWIFTLRDSLRFWDGTRYTATDFAKTWSTSGGSALGSVDPVDDRTFRIRLADRETLPWDLSESHFSLHSTLDSIAGWPLGTGPYRPDSTTLLQALSLVPADTTMALPVLEFWQLPAADPRDLLDRGADVMFTTDPSLIDYADKRGDRSSLPLPWSRTYSLILSQPAESLPASLAALVDSSRAAGFRASLARDAVRADSRASNVPTWTEERGCTIVHTGSPVPSSVSKYRGLLIYPLGDRTAQDLAARLVALVPRRLRWRAMGMGPKDLQQALEAAPGAAFVLPGSYPDGVSCQELLQPVIRLPLVDTRVHAVLRRGSPAWVVDGDGVLRMPLPGTIAP